MDMLHRKSELAPEDERTLLTAATAAPSLHNSQPWSFDFHDDRLRIYADPSRQLTRADTGGRSLLISCGAALFNTRVAAEHLGFRPLVHMLADATDPTQVASIHFGRRQEHVGGLAKYFSAIETRRTNRLPFHDRSVPHSALAAVGEAARAENALLRIYDDADEVARIVELLHEADRAEAHDLAVRTERQAWIGGPQRADGIPVRSLGPRPSGQTAPVRDLGRDVDAPRDDAHFERTPTIAILSTLHDERVDWVRAGQALQRVLLELTRAGLAASFMNQPLEQDELRGLVRSPVTGVGHSHMIMRMGYGDPVPVTPRRPLSAVRRDR